MKIEVAGWDDLDGIRRLYAQLHPEDPELDSQLERQVFEGILASPWLHLFVGRGDGDLLATCYLNVIPNLTRGAAPYAVIENVVTDSERRGEGLGQKIIAHALDVARREGCYKVMLQTGSKRASTHHFYRRCGFSGDDKTAYVARPGGGAAGKA